MNVISMELSRMRGDRRGDRQLAGNLKAITATN